MKRIKLSIDKRYIDGRQSDHFYDEGPLSLEDSWFSTRELSSYLGIKHIDFQTGDIENDRGEIMHSGVPYVIEDSFLVTTVCYWMEDDGVPCNEDTVYLYIECRNSANEMKENVKLPYRKGATANLKPHPYQVTILETNNEEVTVEVKDDKKTTVHLVQFYNHASRSDEWQYATGNPNDPVDTAGPVIHLALMAK